MMRDKMMRKMMTRITRKRRMMTMDDGHNDNKDNDDATIKRE